MNITGIGTTLGSSQAHRDEDDRESTRQTRLIMLFVLVVVLGAAAFGTYALMIG